MMLKRYTFPSGYVTYSDISNAVVVNGQSAVIDEIEVTPAGRELLLFDHLAYEYRDGQVVAKQ